MVTSWWKEISVNLVALLHVRSPLRCEIPVSASGPETLSPMMMSPLKVPQVEIAVASAAVLIVTEGPSHCAVVQVSRVITGGVSPCCRVRDLKGKNNDQLTRKDNRALTKDKLHQPNSQEEVCV